MAALVQTYPQQTSTVTGLQARSTPATMLPAQSHHTQQYMAGQPGQRTYAGAMSGQPVYRSNVGPIQPYAFTTTPNLNTNVPLQPYGGYRTTSSPVVPTSQNMSNGYDSRGRHASNGSMSNASYNGSMGVGKTGSRDDLSIPQPRNTQSAPRPQSAYLTGPPMQMTFAQAAAMKPAPDRYRRTGSYQQQQQQQQPARHQANGSPGPVITKTASPGNSQERATTPRATEEKDQKSLRLVPGDHHSSHIRQGSSESLASSRSANSRPSSRPQSANRNVSTPIGNNPPSLTLSLPDDASLKQDNSKNVSIPPRASSTDAAKRSLNPSPLSRPATMAGNSTASNAPASSGDAVRQPAAAGGNLNSPAAQQLAALSQKGGKPKSKTSRLRRAFSFGSAADFKKAADASAGTDSNNDDKTEPSRLQKDPTVDDLYDAEQAAIAKKQEESGLGNSIYGGRFFSGSTDNLSISSTASSASIMIRKMGRGMKKSGRSLAGLFRPKSALGVPIADGAAPEASHAEVSMITVEAERVNVNPDPRAQNGGGTGFPHLERNSLEVSNAPSMVSERAGSSGTDNSASRKSIVGGDKERAEVLAAVRKGILKHHAGLSPSPSRENGPAFELPNIPIVSDSPLSSAPSTPNDDVQGHKRTGSVAIGGEDYFVSAMKLRQDTKSAPTTPQAGSKRNATFSPRIIFHDTWPSQEYDRRGEIATCNRLTPMLAQQIKEELNTFKMEMEVHENSKIYTHFF